MNRFYLIFSFCDFSSWVNVSEHTFNSTLDYFQKHLHKTLTIELFDDYVFEYCLDGDLFGYVLKVEGVNI